MARVKTGMTTRSRHKKVLKMAKGYFGAKSVRFRMANQAVMKSGMYAYVGRKDKKADFRKLWITRINAACRANDIVYSQFINGLKKAEITINRKMLSELAIFAPEEFTKLVVLAKDALAGKAVKEAKSVEKKVEKTVEDKKDFSKLTVAELKEECEKAGIEVTSSMKKADLVAALEK